MKDKLAPLLRAFKLGYVDLEYTIDFILKVYGDSKKINYNSFIKGIFIGFSIAIIYIYLNK